MKAALDSGSSGAASLAASYGDRLGGFRKLLLL